MLLRILALTAMIPLSLLLSGCACPSGGCAPNTPCMPCINELTVPNNDLPNFVELTSAEILVPLPTPTETYQLLNADTCKCRAATNMTTANLVDLERHLAKIIIECDTKNVAENFCLDRDLLALRATGLRNEAASVALETFYQLAGLEVQKQYLQLGISELQLTLKRINKFQEKGVVLPAQIDRSKIITQLAELEDQKFQLDFTRIQLNGQLQKTTGCPLDEQTFFWPEIDWQPNLQPIDIDAKLAEGLSTRSDLRGINLLLCKLKKHTLPVARGVLKFAESTVGTVEPQDGLIHTLRCFRCNECELPVRCKQLAMFYSDTEQNAIAEIKSAAYQIGLQQQRVVAAQTLTQKLKDRLRVMEETRDLEDISIFEISNAQALVYQAESKLIERVVELFISEVALRKAQGILALECGFCPQLCCEGNCDGDCSCCTQPQCHSKKHSCDE